MTENNSPSASAEKKLSLTAQIVSSYLQKNALEANAVPMLIQSVYASLDTVESGQQATSPSPAKPAVPVNKSITDDHIVCLEDGKKLKMLKRYIRSRFGLTPEEYRQKWGLPAEYPMVAPAYSRKRSAFAKDIGLGKGVGRKKK